MELPLFQITLTAALTFLLTLALKLAIIDNLRLEYEHPRLDFFLEVATIIILAVCVVVVITCIYLGIWSTVGGKSK